MENRESHNPPILENRLTEHGNELAWFYFCHIGKKSAFSKACVEYIFISVNCNYGKN